MTAMRDERVDFLERMDAHKRLPLVPDAPPAIADAPPPGDAPDSIAVAEPNDAEPSALDETNGVTPIVDAVAHSATEADPAAPSIDKPARPGVAHTASRVHMPRYRFRFEKTGPVALLGHLDIVRELPRVFRRTSIEMVYTNGFHPKPDMMFAPALSLGVMSLDEYVDVRLAPEFDAAALRELVRRMNERAPAGLVFREAVRLGPEDAGITKIIRGAQYLLAFARSALGPGGEAELALRCERVMQASTLPFRREIEGIAKMIDVRSFLLDLRVARAGASEILARAGLFGDLVAVEADVAILGSGAVKSSEIAAVVMGETTAPPHRAVRTRLFGANGSERVSPLELRPRSSVPQTEPLAANAE
jgi:radical SAM-linked protein